MSRWVRWYEGTTEDAKFRVVARLSRVTVRDVIALWAFILEDAGHLDHRGVCKRNEDFMAATLDFEEGVVERILEAMKANEMISVGHGEITVCNFCKRQFESDTDPTASRRQREKRQRDRSSRNGPVTRDSRGSDTDTDTEAEKKESAALRAPPTVPAVPRETKKRAKARAPLPEPWSLSEVERTYARERGFADGQIASMATSFENHHRAKGNLMADWTAAWRTWCENEIKFRGNSNGYGGSRPLQDAGNGNSDKSVVAASDRLIERLRALDDPAPGELRGGEGQTSLRLISQG